MTTLDQVLKAYQDLSDDDKKKFDQSRADRVHESIGEQERVDGDKDSQSAADREHEALGAEHADGKGDVSELHETDGKEADKEEAAESGEAAAEERHEDSQEDALKAMREEIAKLSARLDLVERTPQKADETTADKLNRLASRYEN